MGLRRLRAARQRVEQCIGRAAQTGLPCRVGAASRQQIGTRSDMKAGVRLHQCQGQLTDARRRQQV